MDRTIYLDNNATTPLAQSVRDAMVSAMELWGNPSSAHRAGRKSRERLEKARDAVAHAVSAASTELVFTSGGSESNGLAIQGSYFGRGEHFRLLTTAVEHSSIRDLGKWLEGRSVEVRSMGVSKEGLSDLAAYEELLRSFRPHLVSMMSANNETGVLFPIAEAAQLAHRHGALLHTDAVQALGKLPASHWRDADFISVSGHKVHGPKGVGALVVRGGHQLVTTHFGGSQETKRRGGTENFLGIVGFGAACEQELPGSDRLAQMETLRDRMERTLLEAVPDLQIIARQSPRLPNTSCLRVPGIPSEILLGVLDMDGIAVSAGSACSSGSISPSHVLLAMGLTRDEAKECLRVSLSKDTTGEEVDTFNQAVINHVHRIRARKQR